MRSRKTFARLLQRWSRWPRLLSRQICATPPTPELLELVAAVYNWTAPTSAAMMDGAWKSGGQHLHGHAKPVRCRPSSMPLAGTVHCRCRVTLIRRGVAGGLSDVKTFMSGTFVYGVEADAVLIVGLRGVKHRKYQCRGAVLLGLEHGHGNQDRLARHAAWARRFSRHAADAALCDGRPRCRARSRIDHHDADYPMRSQRLLLRRMTSETRWVGRSAADWSRPSARNERQVDIR